MEAYLDNSATTRAFQGVCEVVSQAMAEDYGNPSSMHKKGLEAEMYVRQARTVIARSLKVSEKEIFFTSGGTESNNLALIGAAMSQIRRGRHLITTRIEHPSVHNTMKYLESQGFRVTYLPVDAQGVVRMDALREALDADTTLVSVMHVNNEIGSVQPIEEISRLVHQLRPDALFHVDAVQSFGKLALRPKRQGIDLLSVSGHKIHGPKGVGFLYIRDRVKVNPILFGGGQQQGIRSGTENVPGIAGLGRAVQEIFQGFDQKTAYLYQLRQRFVEGVLQLEGTVVNGQPLPQGAPHVVSVSFRGVRSEVLLHALEERGIYTSAGSACSSNHPALSETLKSIGVEKELLDSTLRFSFSVFTTQEEIDYTLENLAQLLPVLRRYRRG